MNPLSRVNLWLALLILVLGLITAFEPGLQPEALPRLTALSPREIGTIQLHHLGELKFQLSRVGQGWRMQHPRTAKAASDKVQKLLEIATLPSIHQFSAPKDRLEEFGLVASSAKLQLDQLVIQFGNTDPVTRARYALTGDVIHLIPDTHYHHLLSPPETLLE